MSVPDYELRLRSYGISRAWRVNVRPALDQFDPLHFVPEDVPLLDRAVWFSSFQGTFHLTAVLHFAEPVRAAHIRRVLAPWRVGSTPYKKSSFYAVRELLELAADQGTEPQYWEAPAVINN